MKFIFTLFILSMASTSFAASKLACGKIETFLMFPDVVNRQTNALEIGVVALEVPEEDQKNPKSDKSYVGFVTSQWQAVRLSQYKDEDRTICLKTESTSAQILSVYEMK